MLTEGHVLACLDEVRDTPGRTAGPICQACRGIVQAGCWFGRISGGLFAHRWRNHTSEGTDHAAGGNLPHGQPIAAGAAGSPKGPYSAFKACRKRVRMISDSTHPISMLHTPALSFSRHGILQRL